MADGHIYVVFLSTLHLGDNCSGVDPVPLERYSAHDFGTGIGGVEGKMEC